MMFGNNLPLANLTWYEASWIVLGVLWAMMTAWGSWTAWGDLRYARAHPHADPQVQIELLERIRTDRRYEMSSLLGGILLTYLGVRAGVLPPNPAAPEIWAQIAGIGASVYAAVKTWTSIQNRLTRRRFDRRLRRHKETTNGPDPT